MATARRFNGNGNGAVRRQVPEAPQRRGGDEQQVNQPAREFAAGSIRISIWVNDSRENGGQFYSTQIVRRYRDGKSGEWKSGSRFNSSELLTLALLSQEAFRWMLANPLPKNQRESGEDSPEDVDNGIE